MDNDFNLEQIVEKWADVLDYPGLPKIKDNLRRSTVALMMENTNAEMKGILRKDPTHSLTYLLTEAAPTNAMGASSSTPGTGHIDIYDPVLISMIRRSMPNLMAYDVCGVQPMALPTGLVFALRSRYSTQNGKEALFNEANTTFTASAAGNTASTIAANNQVGSDPGLVLTSNSAYTVGKAMSTAIAEALGDSSTNGWQEMALSIESVPVQAKERALKAEYTHELAQDLQRVHGLDAEQELANILSTELMAEINREVIRSIYTTAKFGAQDNVGSAGTFDLDTDSNGRWMVEKFKGLMFQIEREANRIGVETRQGRGNFIICSSDVASALSMAGYLDYSSGLTGQTLDVDPTGNTFAGTLMGKFKVYIDPYFSGTTHHFVVVGYKGTSPFDSGIFYCPYIPMQMYRAVGENTFQPKIGFKTRYGMVAHPFATDSADGVIRADKKNKYYRIFRVANLV